MSIWVVFTFWLLWWALIWIFTYKHLSAAFSSFASIPGSAICSGCLFHHWSSQWTVSSVKIEEDKPQPQGLTPRMPGEQMGWGSSIRSWCLTHPHPSARLSAPSCGPGSTDSSTHFFSLLHSLLHSDMCSDAHSSFPDWGILNTLLVPKCSFLFLHGIYYPWHIRDSIYIICDILQIIYSCFFCSSHSLLSFFTKNVHAEDRGFHLFWSLLYPSA